MKNKHIKIILLACYFLFIAVSALIGFAPGQAIGTNFIDFCKYMLKILPCAFILIGLFEIWVKKETIEKHLGEDSGLKAHLYVILLAGLTVGGIYVALPAAYSMFKKGADIEVVFSYIGLSSIGRVPMTLFEALFMGIGFAVWRRVFSLPLIILSSMALGKYLKKNNYSFNFRQ